MITKPTDKHLEYSTKNYPIDSILEIAKESDSEGYLNTGIPDPTKSPKRIIESFVESHKLTEDSRKLIMQLIDTNIDSSYINDAIEQLIKLQKLESEYFSDSGYGCAWGSSYGGSNTFFNTANPEDPELEKLREKFPNFSNYTWIKIRDEKDLIEELKNIPDVLRKYFVEYKNISEEYLDNKIKITFEIQTKGDDGLTLYNLFLENYMMNLPIEIFKKLEILPKFIWQSGE